MHELIALNPMIAYVLLGLLALAVGSLLNVIIYRLPLMLQAEWQAQCNELLPLPEAPLTPAINLFFPRSFCPHCNTTIPAWHNIPIISYCLLRGTCRQCQQTIPLCYPLVEASCLILSLVAAWFFGFGLSLVFVLLFIWLLIVIVMIDINQQLLPDNLTLSLLWLGLIANTQSLFTSLPNAVLSAAGAYLALWLFVKLYYLITGKIGMGNGDFKLFAALGAWFGGIQLPLILFVSSILGAITGLIYLKATHQTKDTPIPFGPFLCLAGLLSLFMGKSMIRWYMG